MGKRMYRYSDIQQAIGDEAKIRDADNASIVMKSGEVYTGKVLQIRPESVIFKNMRLRQQTVLTSELSEIIIDY